MQHAEAHYRRPDGSITGEVRNYEDALADLLMMYGDSPAAEFGPRKLERVRCCMLETGDLARTTINARVRRIRTFFRWLASKEFVSGEVVASLETLSPLLAGRAVLLDDGTRVTPRETDAVRPANLRRVPGRPWQRCIAAHPALAGSILSCSKCSVNTVQKRA